MYYKIHLLQLLIIKRFLLIKLICQLKKKRKKIIQINKKPIKSKIAIQTIAQTKMKTI